MKYIIILFLSICTITAYSEQGINSSIDNKWPNDRYTDHGNGTVTDSKTKLMWKKCSEGQTGNSCSGSTENYAWKNAFEVAENSTFAGYSDWRLPTIKELEGLAASDRYSPSINIQVFPNTSSAFYWSSSPHPYLSDGVWLLNFYDGYDGYDIRGSSARARLVRVAQ